jgi:general stress protein YciG
LTVSFPNLARYQIAYFEDWNMVTSGKNPSMGSNKDTQKPSQTGKKPGGQGSGGNMPDDRQKNPDANKRGSGQGPGGGTRKS